MWVSSSLFRGGPVSLELAKWASWSTGLVDRHVKCRRREWNGGGQTQEFVASVGSVKLFAGVSRVLTYAAVYLPSFQALPSSFSVSCTFLLVGVAFIVFFTVSPENVCLCVICVCAKNSLRVQHHYIVFICCPKTSVVQFSDSSVAVQHWIGNILVVQT